MKLTRTRRVAALVTVAVAISFTQPAWAFRGVFEAPFVNQSGSEVEGSEGKIGRGLWKVELTTSLASAPLKICLVTTGASLHLGTAATDANGGLKASGIVPEGNYQGPSFMIIGAADGSDNDCTTGDVYYESGMSVVY